MPVGVLVGVPVGVRVGVPLGVRLGDVVGVPVGVRVAVGDVELVGDRVGVRDALRDGVAVRVEVVDAVGLGTNPSVGEGVAAGVALLEGYVAESVNTGGMLPSLTGFLSPTFFFAPVPNAPELPLPQHWYPPPTNTAHEWASPSASQRTAAPPAKDTLPDVAGVELAPTLEVEPMPSCPAELTPQHLTSPDVIITQV